MQLGLGNMPVRLNQNSIQIVLSHTLPIVFYPGCHQSRGLPRAPDSEGGAHDDSYFTKTHGLPPVRPCEFGDQLAADGPGTPHSTLDHLAEDRLDVCLRKRTQRLRANISKGAAAQSKRSHGSIIRCLNDRNGIVLA